jgi:membrane protein YqaA with SNARE-associated domain
MIAVCIATFFTGLVSAFFPVTPIEPYLLGVAATTGFHPFWLGIAGALGQTVGKSAIFLGARGAIRSTRLRGWAEAAGRHRERRRDDRAECAAVDAEQSHGSAERAAVDGERLQTGKRERLRRIFGPIATTGKKLLANLDRPSLTVPILLLSAVTGLPPLLATSIYAGGTRIKPLVFVAVCFVGRSIRFVVIAYAPYLFIG